MADVTQGRSFSRRRALSLLGVGALGAAACAHDPPRVSVHRSAEGLTHVAISGTVVVGNIDEIAADIRRMMEQAEANRG